VEKRKGNQREGGWLNSFEGKRGGEKEIKGRKKRVQVNGKAGKVVVKSF